MSLDVLGGVGINDPALAGEPLLFGNDRLDFVRAGLERAA